VLAGAPPARTHAKQTNGHAPTGGGVQLPLPRSKLAVGGYGADQGDASQDFPLAAESRQARQLAELQTIRERENMGRQLAKLSSETVSLIDARGSAYSTRGTR
jgi:hypothetical protein